MTPLKIQLLGTYQIKADGTVDSAQQGVGFADLLGDKRAFLHAATP